MSAMPFDKRPGPDDLPLPDVLSLRLYVAGRSPNSVRALANLRAMCGEWLADDDWQLEVVDVFADPMRAVEDKILVTPTLLKLTPPLVQIVGDLSQRETVVAALDLDRRAR
jgi:circadian clock protein KaiB